MLVEGNPTLSEWRETVHRFMDEEIGVEYCREHYAERKYPHELYDAAVDNDWLGLLIPEEYGGQGGSFLEGSIMFEALGKYGYDLGMPIGLTTFTALNIVNYGTDGQIERFIPSIISGEIRFSVGITEPQAGSDAANIQTIAQRNGDKYIINGEKTYQTGANVENTIINLYARTDPDSNRKKGLTALLVPNDLGGIEISAMPTVVRKSTGTNHVHLDDVHVPVRNRLGEEGEGWEIMTKQLVPERTMTAALMVGNAQSAVDKALAHARDREQFGQSIGEFQAIKHTLSEMQTEVDAARQLVYRAAAKADAGKDASRAASQANLKASEVFQQVTQDGMQVLGGASVLPENDMERYWREGKASTIVGGTSEIQKSIIGNDLLR